VRMALGAQGADVLGMLLRKALFLVLLESLSEERARSR